jgi:hypothetical protein
MISYRGYANQLNLLSLNFSFEKPLTCTKVQVLSLIKNEKEKL